jgi:hypothetical protein
VTTTQKSIKAIEENNITRGTDDAATGSMETHTSVNGTYISGGYW